MVVTATEFKVNFGKYLSLLATEDIFITKNGKKVAKVSNPNVSAVDAISICTTRFAHRRKRRRSTSPRHWKCTSPAL